MDNILTANIVFMIDAHESPPAVGSSVLALSHGGKLCEAQWKADSLKYFDGYCEYPKIPASIRKRQLERYTNRNAATEGHP